MRLSPVVKTLLVLCVLPAVYGQKSKNAVIEDLVEFKDFKKLLRTKNNVLGLFMTSSRDCAAELKLFREVSMAVRGIGTLFAIDCSEGERKKLCKKLKVAPKPYQLKHYKDGEFHKDYDRQLALPSITNFMRDPTGDLPWEEDPIGADVVHFTDYASFAKHLRKNPRPMLIMFYVPWCGFCKRFKPEYSKAATELKGKGYVLAAMDLDRQENSLARRAYNVTGYPTLLYFENGELRHTYDAENTKAGILSFMQDPRASQPAVHKTKEMEWSADADSEIVHLTAAGFEPGLRDEKSVLVMFYAPWCGHCKVLKPEYEKAAVMLRDAQVPGMLAAVDATKEKAIADRYKVKGYPTLKYFVNGEFQYDVNFRESKQIVDFMKHPKEPLPPPPPEKPWDEEEGIEVLFLKENNFASTLKRKKNALVMFYAPWCGHCKSAKPEFTAAAEQFKDDPRSIFVAVDCTKQQSLCESYGVNGYPTIKYYSYYNKVQKDYTGGRKRQDFVDFLNDMTHAGHGNADEL